MAVNEVPVAASFNTIVPAVAPAPVPKVKVWAPKLGLIFVPSMAAEAFTSAFTITPGAMAVALPEEVTSPVKLALVTTVVALPVLVTIPVRLALVVTVAALPPILKFVTGVVDVTTNGAVPVATVEVNEPVRLRLVPVAAPITGVTRVGEVAKTATPVPVSSEITPANSADVVAANTFNLSVVTTNVFEVGMEVLFTLVAVATPKTGVTKVGEVANTAVPVPVLSDNAPDKFPEENEPNEVAFPEEVTAPVRLALVALFPFSFWIACRMLSVAATVPAPLTKPVKTLPVTVVAEMAVALCVPVTSPESEPEKLVAVPLVISEVKATVPVASGRVIVLLVAVTVAGA